MALSSADVRRLALWPHQADALRVITRYLASNSRAAALVNIPTGGGKSAVIAAAVHRATTTGKVLVLTPRKSLRRQLVADLNGTRGLLASSGLSQSKLRSVIEATGTRKLTDQLDKGEVIVATTQLITRIAARNGALFSMLKARCSAVFVDEGHYEPAENWSRVIRQLGQPTILLTATPYRNDLRGFELDQAAIHVSRYADLRAAGLLRDLRIVERPPSEAATAKGFAEAVLRAFEAEYGALPSPQRRLIIRCASDKDILAVQRAIKLYTGGSLHSIGIHEQFADPSPASASGMLQFRQPPDPSVRQEPVWIHQYKLLEGIDGPCFRAVAVFQALGSARALVQQVGRVLRNPGASGHVGALLVDFSGGRQKRQWERYLAFDAALNPHSLNIGLAEVAAEYHASQPPTLYADGEFRSRLDLATVSAPAIQQSVRVPFRCSLIRSTRTDALEALSELTRQRLTEAECPHRIIEIEDDLLLIVFTHTKTSPFLAEHFFVERQLHIYAALWDLGTIAITDTSRNGVPVEVIKEIGRPVSRSALNRVLAIKGELHFTELTSRSTTFGGNLIRGRTVHGPSLAGTAPLLDDFQFAPATLVTADRSEKASREYTSRSLGFASARVTDSQPLGTIDLWMQWARGLMRRTRQRSRPQPAFMHRFARPLEVPPTRPEARSILLNINAIRDVYVYVDPATEDEFAVDIDDACFEMAVSQTRDGVRRKFKPSANANGVRLDGGVRFDQKGARYVIESDVLRRYRLKDRSATTSLVDYLNANQEFCVVPETPGIVYCDGTFFDPQLQLGPNFDPDATGFDGVFTRSAALASIYSEKGTIGSANSQGWAANSLFAWIDANAHQIVADPQLVICDDGNRESCDFIIVGGDPNRPTVAMVHAKASKRRNVAGASKLQEVCGQAVKQVGMLNSFGAQKPPQVPSWRDSWNGPSGEGVVAARVRRDQGIWSGIPADDLWTTLAAILRSQNTRREVVIVLGASLDHLQLYQRARQPLPPPSAVHAIHLIRSTASSVNAAGASLRIFCAS